MKWEWEAIRELPITSPHERYGNWETAYGTRFFCQWVDACPPCEDVLSGTAAAPCVVTLMTTLIKPR
jgi:hypothetical protein